ncbi:MAG TPA: hypothetical protein VGX69_05410 [Solirubrobacteraceae bacterium]|jgi:hypothetical protein|nr:hypothetical protein [Solirubrobacteraceae bacterium]
MPITATASARAVASRLSRRLTIGLPALAAPASALALALLAPAGAGAAPGAGTSTIDAHTLLRSRLLWATIDVCNAADQPDTLGVRGSMPGDREAHDTMYMRFRLQYLNASKKTWVDLTNGVSPTWASVGSGASARQGGRSFQLSPVAGQPAVTMRGVVSFQWRRGATVLAQASRPTSAGRVSLAGSDPAGFSAATCVIG